MTTYTDDTRWHERHAGTVILTVLIAAVVGIGGYLLTAAQSGIYAHLAAVLSVAK